MVVNRVGHGRWDGVGWDAVSDEALGFAHVRGRIWGRRGEREVLQMVKVLHVFDGVRCGVQGRGGRSW